MRTPQLLTSLRSYDAATFRAVCAAGITVAMVAIPLSLAIAIASGALIVMLRRRAPRFPGLVTAIGATSALVAVFGWPVETIATRFGALPSALPWPALPDLSWARETELFPSAIVIAFLAGIESLLSAMVADRMAMPALAALLILTAWNMSEPHKWRSHAAAPPGDRVLLVLTMALTVLVDLTVAIGVGVAIGLALRLSRRSPTLDSDWTPPDR